MLYYCVVSPALKFSKKIDFASANAQYQCGLGKLEPFMESGRMEKTLDFDTFWATYQAKGPKQIYYHRCCDVWSVNASTSVRTSHCTIIGIKKLMCRANKPGTDRKTYLRELLEAENWQIPLVVNKSCMKQRAVQETQLPVLPQN